LHGAGHSAIDSYTDVYNALARFNQTFFESMAKAKTAWSHILHAAKRFGIEVSDKTMPKPKIQEPSNGYKRTSAALTLTLPPSGGENGSSSRLSPEGGVVSFFAVAINSDDAPEWIELIPAGKFSAVDGRGPFDNADPNSIVAASLARMPEVGLVLDYDHSTDLAAPEGRPSIAAGWIKEFKIERGAIFARIEWTAKTAEALKAKEYRYVSPVFEHSKNGKVERILRAALTNNPALMQLPAIASAQIVDPYEEETMAEKEEGAMKLSEMVRRLEAAMPGASHKHLMRVAGTALSADDGDDAESAGALADWAEEEEHEPERKESVGDGKEETAEEMAKRHEEEMARCSDDEMRTKCASRHAAEKEAMVSTTAGV
jgi:phage I-like protein